MPSGAVTAWNSADIPGVVDGDINMTESKLDPAGVPDVPILEHPGAFKLSALAQEVTPEDASSTPVAIDVKLMAGRMPNVERFSWVLRLAGLGGVDRSAPCSRRVWPLFLTLWHTAALIRCVLYVLLNPDSVALPTAVAYVAWVGVNWFCCVYFGLVAKAGWFERGTQVTRCTTTANTALLDKVAKLVLMTVAFTVAMQAVVGVVFTFVEFDYAGYDEVMRLHSYGTHGDSALEFIAKVVGVLYTPIASVHWTALPGVVVLVTTRLVIRLRALALSIRADSDSLKYFRDIYSDNRRDIQRVDGQFGKFILVCIGAHAIVGVVLTYSLLFVSRSPVVKAVETFWAAGALTMVALVGGAAARIHSVTFDVAKIVSMVKVPVDDEASRKDVWYAEHLITVTRDRMGITMGGLMMITFPLMFKIGSFIISAFIILHNTHQAAEKSA